MSLKRALGPFEATMVVVGGIISTGIFVNRYMVAACSRLEDWRPALVELGTGCAFPKPAPSGAALRRSFGLPR